MPNLSHRAQMRPSERAPPPVSNTPEAPNYSRMRQNSHIVPHSAFVSRHLPQTAEKTISLLLPACFAFLPAGRQAAQYGRRAALFRCAQYARLAALCSRAALASALRAYAALFFCCRRQFAIGCRRSAAVGMRDVFPPKLRIESPARSLSARRDLLRTQ